MNPQQLRAIMQGTQAIQGISTSQGGTPGQQMMPNTPQYEVVHTPSPFEQALQMAGQHGRGVMTPLLNGSIGNPFGNIDPRGMMGKGMGAGLGSLLHSIGDQGTMGGLMGNMTKAQQPGQAFNKQTSPLMAQSTLGYMSSGPGRFNPVTPDGKSQGAGNVAQLAPQPNSQPMENPFLQMLHQRGMMQPFKFGGSQQQ